MIVIPIQNFGTNEWEIYYRFHRLIHQECYPFRDMPERETFLQSPRLLTTSTSDLSGFILSHRETWIGCCHYSINSSLGLLTSEVKFLKASFNPDSANAMLNALLQICRDHGIPALQMVAETDEVKEYYMSNGDFLKVGEVRESVLDIAQLDQAQQENWLHLVSDCDLKTLDWNNELSDAAAALHNEGSRDMPLQNVIAPPRQYSRAFWINHRKKLQAYDHDLLTYGLYRNSEIIGLAMFEYQKVNPQTFSIQFTGIDRRFRGRGLAKGLKAITVKNLCANYPRFRYAVTGNEETNGPMLHINLAMGFRIRSTLTMLRYNKATRG